MPHLRNAGRCVLLALSLLSACAAADSSAAPHEARGRGGCRAAAGTPHCDYLTGVFARRQGDEQYAADQLLKAVALAPDDREVKLQAFSAALLADRPEAVRLARQLPDELAAQLMLANEAALTGAWAEAERRYNALPRQGITQPMQPLFVAWSQLGGGRADTALNTLKSLTEGQRHRAVYAMNAAIIADLASRAGEAQRLFRLAQSDFLSPNLQMARAFASFQARGGHEAEARQTLSALLPTLPDLSIALPRLQADMANRPVRRATDGLAETYFSFAIALRQQDSNEFAAILLHLALQVRPDHAAARLLLSEVDEAIKQPRAALAALAAVSADDPLAPVAELRRVTLQERLDNTEEALRLAAVVAAAYPNQPQPWALRGTILRAHRRFAEAAEAFDKALASTPQPYARSAWALFFERGIANDRAHDWPRAQADFEQALKLAPDQPSVLNYLGYSWTEQGKDLAAAKQMIERAADQRPNDGAIIDSLGWVTLKQGDVPGAVTWLEKAAELESQDPTINAHLGDAYWAAGRKLEASFQWRRALSLNPDPEDLPKLQSKLKEADQALGVRPTATAEKAAEAKTP